jgi:SecD/SecF fusion protein
LNQVLMRSVNTSLVVLLPILSLLVFGGDTLKDFAFAMFVGTAIGAYSSIFIAAPVLTLFHREPERARRVPGVARQPSARTAAVATGDAAAAATTARQGRPSGTRPRPSGKRRPPAKRKRR